MKFEIESRINIKNFLSYCIERNSSVFIGCGTPTEAGLPLWDELFSNLSRECEIDLKSYNYNTFKIAQFITNKLGRERVLEEIRFKVRATKPLSPTLQLLIEMNFNDFWTTNFDRTIELNLEHRNKVYEVFTNSLSLKKSIRNDISYIYKINGSLGESDNALVTQDDLEKSEINNQLYYSFLKRELLTKTFLFVGYSFRDEVVLKCLADLKKVFHNDLRDHYSIFKKPTNNEELFYYQDLEQRYKIHPIYVDNHSEIPVLLGKINENLIKRQIFISGSLTDKGIADEVAQNFVDKLVKALINNNNRIISGHGYKIGYYVSGTVTQLARDKSNLKTEKFLEMLPFSPNFTANDCTNHREYLISKSRCCLFIYGRNDEDGIGMREEFEIAQKLKKVIIPIPSTGGNALRFYKELENQRDNFPYLLKYYEELGKEDALDDKIIKIIIEIINETEDNALNLLGL